MTVAPRRYSRPGSACQRGIFAGCLSGTWESARTITIAGVPGLLEVSPGRESCLLLRVHLPYWEGLIHVVGRVGLLLGVESDHSAGAAALSGDPVLGPLVAKHPGLAVPGAWNPFEAGVSAILSGGDSMLEAFVARLGTPVPGLPDGLTHTFPDPATVTPASLAPIGLGPAEASAITALAAYVRRPGSDLLPTGPVQMLNSSGWSRRASDSAMSRSPSAWVLRSRTRPRGVFSPVYPATRAGGSSGSVPAGCEQTRHSHCEGGVTVQMNGTRV
jgi:AlkA N-terminal domain